MGRLTDLVVSSTKVSAKGIKKMIDKKSGKFNYDFCDNGEMLPPEMMSGTFFQDAEGNISFGKNSRNLYRAIGYRWVGPNIQEYLATEEHGAKRTAILTGGGALLGLSESSSAFGALAGGLVGRMMGGGIREKVKVKQREIKTPAILGLKDVNSGQVFNLGFLCDKSLNKRITTEIQFDY